jgi:DNA-binding protein HU-beta
MTKSQIIDAVAKKADLKKKDAEAAVNATLEAITDALVEGEKVQVVGFGTFEVKGRAARTGINPRTKKAIKIKASKTLSFKAGKAMKELLNK